MRKSTLAALVLALAHLTCAGVPLTAPSGSTLTLNANPTFVAANGGTSAVTAIVVEAAGTFVPDGTVVFFLTDLGRIDAQAKTKNGFAYATFVSDSRSGHASVRAFSGGNAPAPSPSASAAATPSVSALAVGASGPPLVTAAENISDSVTIDIGSALPQDVIATANPLRITQPRNAEITANVFDKFGNPVVNVPVIFSVEVKSAGRLLQESLDSGGQPRYTDTNGQARDTLRTSQNRADPQKVVTVTATPPLLTGASVDVAIN